MWLHNPFLKLLLKIFKLVVLKKSPKLACNDKWNTFRINVKPGFHMIAVIAAIAGFTVISFHGQIVRSQIVPLKSQIVPQNSQIVPQKSQFVPNMKSQVNFSKFLSPGIMFNLKPLYIKRANKHVGYVVLYWIYFFLCCGKKSTNISSHYCVNSSHIVP